jgi:DNA-binding response OmpR family regulator
MKPAIILLLTTDPEAERLARHAVTATRHGLRVFHTAAEAFQALDGDCDDIDAVLIDLDPGVHGTALLEAIGDRLPVIVLTSLEADYMRPVASRHGARECITKPFNAVQLQVGIERVLAAV